MIDYQAFLNRLDEIPELTSWSQTLAAQIAAGLSEDRYGDLPRWKDALAALPNLSPETTTLDRSRVGADGPSNEEQRQQLHNALKGLHPWRKGPYDLFGVHIDTEWRSDWIDSRTPLPR